MSVEIDDCDDDTCADTGVCVDDTRGHHCLCDTGFTGSRCELNIDDCLSNPCIHGSCKDNGTDRFICICDNGFEGHTCNIGIQTPAAGILLSNTIYNTVVLYPLPVVPTHCSSGWIVYAHKYVYKGGEHLATGKLSNWSAT